MLNDIVSYSIVGFESMDRNATYHEEFDSEIDAAIEFVKLVKSKKYESIVVRKEERDPEYGENLSSSTPIFRWPVPIKMGYCPELIKQYHAERNKEIAYA